MKRLHQVWYVPIIALILAPIGLRLVTWSTRHVPATDAPMVDAGHRLFMHEWTPNDPLSPEGDGLGPVYNATSCLECHSVALSGLPS